MFTPEERGRLRSELLAKAAKDTRISGAAITGSAAAQREDQWSDIDLAFGVSAAHQLPEVMADWTAHMYDRYRAVDYLDIPAGTWIYRVFLLPSTLQVDLAFVPAKDFRPLAETFKLVHGTAHEPATAASSSASHLVGMAWLYALHARSSIARGQLWQAEYMVSGMRDSVLALVCLRNGLPVVHGRGLDRLPREVHSRIETSLIRKIEATEISRAFRAILESFLEEVRIVNAPLARQLENPLTALTG